MSKRPPSTRDSAHDEKEGASFRNVLSVWATFPRGIAQIHIKSRNALSTRGVVDVILAAKRDRIGAGERVSNAWMIRAREEK